MKMKIKLYKKVTLILVLISCAYLSSYAQCNLERHNTTWYDGWVSCKKKPSPNPTRGNSHWIMYELGYKYILGDTYFWNHNVPYSLGQGAKTIAIDYSIDGISWESYGNVTLQQATGLNTYSGEEGPYLNNVEARFVLITVLDTYGEACAGISEVKINVSLPSHTNDDPSYQNCMQINTYPNPFVNQIEVVINNQCSDNSEVYICDITGKRVSINYSINSTTSTIQIPTQTLQSGIYYLHVISNKKNVIHKIIKVE
jgi:hypothetical protein